MFVCEVKWRLYRGTKQNWYLFPHEFGEPWWTYSCNLINERQNRMCYFHSIFYLNTDPYCTYCLVWNSFLKKTYIFIFGQYLDTSIPNKTWPDGSNKTASKSQMTSLYLVGMLGFSGERWFFHWKSQLFFIGSGKDVYSFQLLSAWKHWNSGWCLVRCLLKRSVRVNHLIRAIRPVPTVLRRTPAKIKQWTKGQKRA